MITVTREANQMEDGKRLTAQLNYAHHRLIYNEVKLGWQNNTVVYGFKIYASFTSWLSDYCERQTI